MAKKGNKAKSSRPSRKRGASLRSGQGKRRERLASNQLKSEESRAGRREGHFAVRSSMVAVVLVCVLVLFQGGFYPGATCAVGFVSLAVYAVVAMRHREMRACGWLSGSLFVLAMLYAISALAHGAAVTMLQEAATWFALAGMSLWCVPATSKEKRQALQALGVVGAALSVLGILMYVGFVPLEGAVNAGRLMFTFQYANTAGLFFAVIAVLCLCNPRVFHRIAALLPIVALALTKSVGATLVFLVALVAIGIRWIRREKPARPVVASAVLCVLAVLAVVAFIAHGRLAQATQTSIERVIQVLDASSLLMQNLLVGIGPDQWQFAYPFAQTAQYRAADVHCSYLQIGLDAGVFALALMLVMVIAAVRDVARRGGFASLVCTCMIALHAMVDFDFQFSSVVLIFTLLSCEPRDESGVRPRWRLPGWLGNHAGGVCVAVVTCSLFASLGGLYLDTRVGEVQRVAIQGDIQQAVEMTQTEPYLRNDRGAIALVTNALYDSGDYQDVVDFTTQEDNLAANAGLLRAISLYETGNRGEAMSEFEKVLRSSPYQVELYQVAREAIVQGVLDGAFADSYDEISAWANGLLEQGHSAWLADREPYEMAGGKA